VSEQRDKPDPLALAMEWVTKITTVALEMVLPAIGGGYLDKRFGTKYWALVGVILGMVVGMWHLLQMTRPPSRPRDELDGEKKDGGAKGE